VLTNHEKLKYSRQIMLDNIGEQGQLALQNANVLIVGMGGLGNPAAQYLAAAGVGKLYLADGDNIEISNLPRQILFNENDLGNNKADVAHDKLQQQYPDTVIEVIDEMLDEELARYHVSQVDIVLDCTDNISARYLINKICYQEKIPLVIGAATGFDGQCLVVNSNENACACYQCLFPNNQKAPAQNCQTVGVLGPILAIIAGMQVLQAIKMITGQSVENNKFMMFDGMATNWQKFNLSQQENCPICCLNS
jgi:sulfur carrier protein ThiS adenylyltransferase